MLDLEIAADVAASDLAKLTVLLKVMSPAISRTLFPSAMSACAV